MSELSEKVARKNAERIQDLYEIYGIVVRLVPCTYNVTIFRTGRDKEVEAAQFASEYDIEKILDTLDKTLQLFGEPKREEQIPDMTKDSEHYEQDGCV
jgi:hypothetical protein